MKRVLVIGGSIDFPGAVFLAGVSALRAGAESVMIMTPRRVAWTINALSPDLITRKLPGQYLAWTHYPVIKRQLKTADILVLGNGATTKPQVARLMRRLMRWPGLKVVDADALKVLRQNQIVNAVLTPNESEWRLLNQQNSIPSLLKNNIVIIKKGTTTSIISARKKIKMRVNPGLTKAGTGDVLAGLCAGYLAQGYSLWQSARKAAKTGNDIANLLTKKKKGYYFLASDITAEIKKL